MNERGTPEYRTDMITRNKWFSISCCQPSHGNARCERHHSTQNEIIIIYIVVQLIRPRRREIII